MGLRIEQVDAPVWLPSRSASGWSDMTAANIISLTQTSPPTVYLGISGVLHPSASTYELLNGQSPWSAGHKEYESVSVLERALSRWPQVRLVLTSTQPWKHGLEPVLGLLGLELASRVVGFTFEDLTRRVKREVRRRDGTVSHVPYSSEDYWRMSKAQIVLTHAAWSLPRQWVAIDDEDILWPPEVRRDRLVLTDGCVGLRGKEAQDDLTSVLAMNFGNGAR